MTHPNNPTEVVLLKSINLKEIPVIWKTYHDLTIKKQDNRVDKWIRKYETEIKNTYSAKNWRKASIFSGYIKLHDKYSMRKDITSSSERLIDFILKRGSIPNINTFVDIYNVVSAFTGISIGAHDIGTIVGNVCLEVLEKDIQFEMIGGGRHDTARRGEYAYIDKKGILCRLDIKQSQRTKVTEKTRDVLVVFQGHEDLQEQRLERGVELLEAGMKVLRI